MEDSVRRLEPLGTVVAKPALGAGQDRRGVLVPGQQILAPGQPGAPPSGLVGLVGASLVGHVIIIPFLDNTPLADRAAVPRSGGASAQDWIVRVAYQGVQVTACGHAHLAVIWAGA